MTEDKQYQLDELTASDILSYLVSRVFGMEEHIRSEKKQFANLKKESNRLFLEGAKSVEEELEYAKIIIQELLNNSDEYARQRAIDFLKEKE